MKKKIASVRYSDTFHQHEVVQESKTNESIVEARNRSPSQSLYKSSSSRLNTEDNNKEEEDDEDDDDDDNDKEEEEEENEEEDDEEEEFSSHFERMRRQVEEPAFLPKQLEGSLAASRIQISKSIQNLRKDKSESEPASPKKALLPQSTAPGSNNESAINSSTSSFSDISESSVTQSAMEDAFLSNFNHGSKL